MPHKHQSLNPSPTERRDLLGIRSLSVETIIHLLDRSDHYYEMLLTSAPFPTLDYLAGRTAANLFFENSTRTRTSFELAERRMGADCVSLSPQISSLTKGESLLDTVRVLEAMKLDCIVVRHSSTGVPQFIADHVPAHVHVVNAGDGANEHPTQGLLDAATMRMAMGSISGKKVVIVGDIMHSRVARSNIWLLKKLGAQVTLVGPATLMPRHAEEVFGVEVRDDLGDMPRTADAIIALRIQHERMANGLCPTLGEYHERYGLTAERLIGSQSYILHPGPANMGVELTMEVADSEKSLILAQVKRGVAVRMAVLEWVFGA